MPVVPADIGLEPGGIGDAPNCQDDIAGGLDRPAHILRIPRKLLLSASELLWIAQSTPRVRSKVTTMSPETSWTGSGAGLRGTPALADPALRCGNGGQGHRGRG